MSPDELFGADDRAVIAPVGVSMRPLLLSGRDTVALGRIRGPLKRGDVALYERSNGSLVLHRVLKVEPAGYAFLGDAQPMSALEKGVQDNQLIGVMTGFFRGTRYYDVNGLPYHTYRLMCLSGGARRVLRRLWKCHQAGKRMLTRSK